MPMQLGRQAVVMRVGELYVRRAQGSTAPTQGVALEGMTVSGIELTICMCWRNNVGGLVKRPANTSHNKANSKALQYYFDGKHSSKPRTNTGPESSMYVVGEQTFAGRNCRIAFSPGRRCLSRLACDEPHYRQE